MKRIYDTGLDSNTITLEVSVGTVGVAYTATYLFRSGGQWNKIIESNAQSGNIPLTQIGLASNLRKSYIVVRTLIDLSYLSNDERESAEKNILIEYKFDGGLSGIQIYNPDLDDFTVTPNKKLISITKPIEMI
jgi:hypothetical protein